MFRRKRFDRVRQVQEDKPGWSTNGISKPVMEATFAAALQDGTHGLRDVQTARQLSTYVITEKGKHEAQEGEHDDRLVTAMIAHQIMELLRPPRSPQRPPIDGLHSGDGLDNPRADDRAHRDLPLEDGRL
jgi:hypothetical protein